MFKIGLGLKMFKSNFSKTISNDSVVSSDLFISQGENCGITVFYINKDRKKVGKKTHAAKNNAHLPS